MVVHAAASPGACGGKARSFVFLAVASRPALALRATGARLLLNGLLAAAAAASALTGNALAWVLVLALRSGVHGISPFSWKRDASLEGWSGADLNETANLRLEPVMNLRTGAGSRHNRPSAALRRLAVTCYSLDDAPCVWPVLTAASSLPKAMTVSSEDGGRLRESRTCA